jgi:hypothetical protein
MAKPIPLIKRLAERVADHLTTIERVALALEIDHCFGLDGLQEHSLLPEVHIPGC